MKKTVKNALLVGCSALLWLASAWWVVDLQHLQGADPTAKKASLPELPKDEDEFYARVDKVNSPTELTVTVLDAWNPLDKRNGLRWPKGVAKVRPTKRAIILEDISVPDSAEQRKRALDFLQKTLDESGNENDLLGRQRVSQEAARWRRYLHYGLRLGKAGIYPQCRHGSPRFGDDNQSVPKAAPSRPEGLRHPEWPTVAAEKRRPSRQQVP